MIKKNYVYPAQFENEDNGSISVFFPDLIGCQTYEDNIESAFIMAEKALESYIETLLEEDIAIPKPSDIKSIKVKNGSVMLVSADIENMEKQTKFTKVTLSLPLWMYVGAKKSKLNMSRVFQEALHEKLVF